MKDPELRAAEEELRAAQKKAQAALVKGWETQGPGIRYRLLAFIAPLQWGLVVNMVLLELRHVIIPRTYANGYKAPIGLSLLPFVIVLLAPLLLIWLGPRWTKVFKIEIFFGIATGFMFMCYLVLR